MSSLKKCISYRPVTPPNTPTNCNVAPKTPRVFRPKTPILIPSSAFCPITNTPLSDGFISPPSSKTAAPFVSPLRSSHTLGKPLSLNSHRLDPIGKNHAEKLSTQNIQTVIFDFDLTLINKHSYRLDLSPDDVNNMDTETFESYFNDAAYIKTLLSQVQEIGLNLRIASFGEKSVIHAFMTRLLGSFSEDHIQTCFHYEGKNHLIQDMIGNQAPTSVLFIDDTPELVTDAKYDLNIHAYHIDNSQEGPFGLTSERMEAAINTLLAIPEPKRGRYDSPTE